MVSFNIPLVALSMMVGTSTAISDQLLLGPVFESPTELLTSKPIRLATENLAGSLTKAFRTGNTPFGSFTGNDTSLSLTVMTTDRHKPILDFHHTAPTLNISAGSTSKVTADSVYRIGSISKLFTVYALLLNGGVDHWNKPVTDYIPELRQAVDQLPPNSTAIDHVQWDQVTVGSLASQLSGIGRDYNNADLISQGFPWKQAGLPLLPPADIPSCAGNESQPPCDRKEYFQGFVKRHPVYLPYTTPVYSNTAYRLLAYVIEAITNDTYPQVVKTSVFDPLNLKRSSTLPPRCGRVGVIPSGDPGWGRDLGDEVSTGGLYSTTNDLAEFGRAILTSKQLSPAETRRWMKPQTHTSSLYLSIGAPWEITRTRSKITEGHIVDLYTKSGSDGEYESLLILVPDYDLVISILAAGPDASLSVNTAAELSVQSILPALEKVARTQACQRFCGNYRPANGKKGSSLVLDVDNSGPGLLVKSWMSNGADIIAAAQAYADSTNGGEIKSIRLYPTNLRSSARASDSVSYRAIVETVPPGADASVPRVFDPTSGQWARVDQLMYGEVAMDEFVFHLDKHGSAVAVEPRVLRQTLERTRRTGR